MTDRPQASITAIVAMITAVAGLISAIAAFKKAPEEPTAEASYSVLQVAYKEQALELDETKADLVKLRLAFEDYVRAKEGTHNVVAEADGPHVLPTMKVSVQSASSATHIITIPSARANVAFRPPLPSFSAVQSQGKL